MNNQANSFILRNFNKQRFKFRHVAAICALFSAVMGMKAADDTCSTPVIVTSTGEVYFCPGVSTVTITAGDDELISYTTGYDDEPSTDLADAVEGPVVIRLTETTDYCIKAVALSATKAPGKCATQEAWALKPSGYENYQRLYVAKATGIVPGPFYVYAIEQLRVGSKYWMVLCHPETPTVETSIIVELAAYPDGINVGETIDYINVKTYDNMTTPASGGMKRVTDCVLPSKSYPCEKDGPHLEQLDGTASYGQDFWIDHWRVPVEISNAVVSDNMFDEQLIPNDKFKNITPEFEEGVAYNLRGFAGTDASDSHYAMRFFVISYEKAGQGVPDARSISEAFDFEGENQTAVLAFDLSVVTFDRDQTHLFAVDASGDCVAIRDDFAGSDLQPGDIISGFTATLSKSDGVCYADVDAAIERSAFGEEAAPRDIDVAALAQYSGQYVRFESVIERPATTSSRAAALPEIRVGGITVNPAAISDGTAETIGYAVNDYDPDEVFSFRGIVMPDGEGGQEFWPVEVLVLSGQEPTTGQIGVIVGEGVIVMREGRPILGVGQEMHDLMGRPADAATAPSGLYIVAMPGRAVKVVVR